MGVNLYSNLYNSPSRYAQYAGLGKELRYNIDMQEYVVEVFTIRFDKLFDIGPFAEEKAREVARVYRLGGHLATITEKELV